MEITWDQIGIAIVTCPKRAGMAEQLQAMLPVPAKISMDIERNKRCLGRDNYIVAMQSLAGCRWALVLEDDVEVGPELIKLPDYLASLGPKDAGLWLYVTDKLLKPRGVLPYSPMSSVAVAYDGRKLPEMIEFLKVWWAVPRQYGTGFAVANYLKRAGLTAKRTMPSLVDHRDGESVIGSRKKPERRSVSFDQAYRSKHGQAAVELH